MKKSVVLKTVVAMSCCVAPLAHGAVEVNLLEDPGFNALPNADSPNAGEAPWFTEGEANVWVCAKQGSAVKFQQRWGGGACYFGQNMDAQLDTTKTYEVVFSMLTQTNLQGGSTDPSVDVELWTSATSNGTYESRATFAINVANTTTNEWEQFTYSVEGSTLTDYADHYLSLRVKKKNGATGYKYSLVIDDMEFGVQADPLPEFPEYTGNVLSVNYNGGASSGDSAIDSNEVWGIVSSSNWANGTYLSGPGLQGSVVSISTVGNGGTTTNYGGAAFAKDTAFIAGIRNFPTTSTPASFTLSNMNTEFPHGYDVFVYITGFNGDTYTPMTATGQTDRYVDITSISLDYKLITSTDSNAPTVGGNFVYYTNVTADTFTFELGLPVGGGQTAIGGFQIAGLVGEYGYAGWTDIYNLVEGPNGDDDNDGLLNLYEYGLGGNPTNGFVDGNLPAFGDDGSGMTYIHAQRNDDTNLVYYLETDTDLVATPGWTNSGYTVTGTNTSLGGNFDEVTNSIPTGDLQKFIQLIIENN